MPFSFNCPNCAQQYKVPDKLAGKRMACKNCGTAMTLPGEVLDVLEVLPDEEPVATVAASGSELPGERLAPVIPRPLGVGRGIGTGVGGRGAYQASRPQAGTSWWKELLRMPWLWIALISVKLVILAQFDESNKLILGPLLLLGGVVVLIFFAVAVLRKSGQQTFRERFTQCLPRGICGLLILLLGTWLSIAVGTGYSSDAPAAHAGRGGAGVRVTKEVPTAAVGAGTEPEGEKPGKFTLVRDTFEGKEYQAIVVGTQPENPTIINIYLPPGNIPKQALSCVFMAAESTNPFTGAAAVQKTEYQPYVKAGLAVVTYQVAGATSWAATPQEIQKAMKTFIAAHGGLDDAKTTLDQTLANFPELNPQYLYAVGHGTAATLALNLVAADSRIKGVIACNPTPDLTPLFALENPALEPTLYAAKGHFAKTYSPCNQVDRMQCPIFIFADRDTPGKEYQAIAQYVSQLRAAGKKVHFPGAVYASGHRRVSFQNGTSLALLWLSRLAPEQHVQIAADQLAILRLFPENWGEADSQPPASMPPPFIITTKQPDNQVVPETSNPFTAPVPQPPTSRNPVFTPPPILTPEELAAREAAQEKARTEARAALKARTEAESKLALAHYSIDPPKGYKEDLTAQPGTRRWTKQAPGRRVVSTYQFSVRKVGENYYFNQNQDNPITVNGITFYRQMVPSSANNKAQRTVKWAALDDVYFLEITNLLDAFDTDADAATELTAKSIKAVAEK